MRATTRMNMVRLTRLNQQAFLLNPDLIEQVEVTPTTVITLSNGHKLLVRESAEEVIERIAQFRRSVKTDKVLPHLTLEAGMSQ